MTNTLQISQFVLRKYETFVAISKYTYDAVIHYVID